MLQACGANPVTQLTPQVTGSNLTPAEDSQVWSYCLSLLGADGTFNIPSTTIPGTLNPTTVAAFKTYLANQLTASGTSPYLLVCHAAPMLIPTILASFTGSTINVVNMTRTAANTRASLAAAAGVTLAQATTYINGYNSALTTANGQLTSAGITPLSVNWDTILSASYNTVQTQITSLGLTLPPNITTLLNSLVSSFGS